MEYLLALVGLLLGAFGYNFLKRKSAESLLENNEVKSKLNEEDKNKAQNDGRLEAEESRRTDFLKDSETRKNEPVKPEDF